MNGVRHFVLVLGLFVGSIHAQTDSLSLVVEDSTYQDSLGYAQIIADSNIIKLENARIHQRQVAIEVGLSTMKVDGFVIMIGFDQNRAKAVKMLNSANVKYAGSYTCKLEYDEPNFKVFMGEFLEYSDAAKVVNLVRRSFPMARVIKDKIKAPPGYFDREEDE